MKSRALATSTFGLLLGLAAIGCSGPESFPTVELNVWSGTPNPRWTLTSAETAELRGRLQGLPEAREASMPPVVLGYQGFTVYDPGVICERVAVTAGLVFAEDEPAGHAVYVDAKGVELWLQDQARRLGWAGLVPPR